LLTQYPIGLAGGVNLYAYAGNNPVAYRDPYGLGPCDVALPCPPPSVVGGLLAGVGRAASIVADAIGTAALAVISTVLSTSDEGERPKEPATVRLQAQGGGLEQSVFIQSGASGTITSADGQAGLARLAGSLSPSDAAARAGALAKAERFIAGASVGGGIGPMKKSFYVRPKSSERIDVEVLRGTAFQPGPRSDAAIQ
jgi:uncharacterized protein RhaS with RHS repeats